MKRFLLLALIFALASVPAFAAQTWVTNLAGTVIVSDSLKAAGSTDTLKVRSFSLSSSTTPIKTLTLQFKVVDVNTNVVVALESSHDGINWFNLDSDGNTTVTSDSTYAFEVEGIGSKRYFRFRIVSEAGGTDVIVVPKWIFGG